MPRKPQYRALAGIDREALAEVKNKAGSQFCPRCVAALERILPIEGFDDEEARQRVMAAS